MFAQSASHGIGGDPLKWGYACTLTAGSVLPVSRKGSIYMVDGSGTINRLTPLPKGAVVDLHFNAAPTLVHSTLLLLPGSANVTVDAGSVARFISLGNGVWRCAALDTTYGRQLAAAVSASAARTTLGLASVPREVLTANRTYYVRTDGSDSNTGLANTSGGAFLTIQKAIDVAVALDLSIYDVTIQIGAGTYSSVGNELKSIVGSGKIIIVGDETTPANVTVTQTGSPTNSQGCFYAFGVQGIYSLRGMKLTSATAAGYGINISGGSRVEFQNMNFGAITIYHVRAVDGATLEVTGNYTISGGAVGHVVASSSIVRCQSRTITLSGTPAFSGQFANATAAGYYIASILTFSGSATGPRYSATLNGVINTAGGGASYFPGDSAGSTATGGQYA